MYLKRNRSPKSWPISRKGSKYVVMPKSNLKDGIPLLIVLRDVLEMGKTRREVRKILLSKNVKVNGAVVKDDRRGLVLYDSISLGSGENYRVVYDEKGIIRLIKISESESKEKISKIINKRILKGNKVQLSLLDGRTLLSKNNIGVGNSVVISLADGGIKKEILLKEGAGVVVISGSHLGEEGSIKKITDNKAMVKIGDKEVGLELKSLMAIK